jgi:hypothetical protein
MKTTDLFYGRVPTIKTQGRSYYVWTYSSLTGNAIPLRVDAGFGPEDPDHSRGYVRLELDRRDPGCGGGLAFQILRAAAVRDGALRDVLEFHSRGDCESESLAHALIFAGTQLLTAMGVGHTQGEDSSTTGDGILHDSPSGSVWQEAK